MNNDATVIVGKLDDKALRDSIDSLVETVNKKTQQMAKDFNESIKEMQASLKSLGSTKIDSVGSSDGGSSRRARAQAEETKAVDTTTNAYDQQADAMQKATTNAKKYSDEVMQQAKAIRESDEWIKKGSVLLGDRVFYNPETSSMPKKFRQELEEQIVNASKEQEEIEKRKAREIEAEKKAREEELGVIRNQVVVEQQINQTQQQRNTQGKPKTFSDYDSLRGAIASVLNVQQEEVILANSETASYNKLSQTLKQLQTAYNKLNAEQRDSDNGRVLAASIQEVQHSLTKIQQQATRPTNLKALMGLDENTLDNITYKMQQLARYRSGIDITDSTKAREIKEVNEAYARLQKEQQNILGQNRTLLSSNNALTRSFNYMKNRLAFYFTVGASTRLVNSLLRVRSEYEMNERALGILVDSAARGTRIFNELSQMSLVSPYTLIELSAAAKQLTAYDVAAKDVVDTTRRLADMASAVEIPVERLTYALGQIKAYGYLNARDARMFANAGIPLVKQLADYYAELEGRMVSTADIYDRIKKKAIDYADVMNVVNRMTNEGGKFFDFQAKMAETLKVRIANFTLAWNNMLNDLGKSDSEMINNTIKGLTEMLKQWRVFSRIIATLIVSIGTYKTIQTLTLLSGTKGVSTLTASFFSFIATIDSGTTALAALRSVMSSIPFIGWATAISALVSYFIFFNNSSEETKQKAEEVKNAFEGLRKETSDLFVDAIKTDNIGTQLSKLRDMIELAKSEMDIEIPINLEDVNEGNIREKLKEAKRFIDEYINFANTFSETAVGSGLNKSFNNFGANARTVYTSVTESINTVIDAIMRLQDAGEASERDIEILNELTSGQKKDESRIEYLQRLVKLYEELGLLGKKEETPVRTSYGVLNIDTMEELEKGQEKALGRLRIKSKEVFSNMLVDVQDYYISSDRAASEFEKQVERVAKKIDINNIPVEQRTLKLSAAINEEASLNNWNQFEKEYARQIANKKFGTSIVISEESKGVAEAELHEWQKQQQKWMDDNKIGVKLNFQSDDTELSYAQRKLQDLKNAIEEVEVQQRKLKVGTGSQEALDVAIKASKIAREEAKAAGADLSQLDKNKSQKDVLGEALQKEVEIVTNMQKKFNEYRSAGVSAQEAVTKATDEYGSTLKATNATLAKYGIATKNGKELSQMRLRDIRDYFVSLREEAIKLGNTKGIEALEKGIANLNTEITKLDYKRITEGLNNELAKLKDEYELSVELGADPELGDMFTSLFDIDPNQLPKTIDEYAERVLQRLNAYFRNTKVDLQLPTLNLTDADLDSYRQMLYDDKITQDAFSSIESSVKAIREMRYSEVRDLHNQIKDLQYELADQYGKIAIEEKKLSVLRNRLANESREEQKRLLELQIEKQEQVITELKSGILQLMPTYKKLFGDVSEYSAATTRRLANNLKQAYLNAQKNVVGTQKKGDKLVALYQYVDPESGETVIMTMKELGQAIEKVDKEASKSKSTFEKLKDAFDGNSEGVKDSAKGIELIGEELNKVADGVRLAGNIAQALGADEETVGVINDIGQALDGLGQVAQGIGQMATDPIGGVVNVIGGLFSAIGSIFNGYNRRINREIKKSEEAVDQLSLAYQRLEFAVEKSMGSAETYWRRAAIENKKMQLEELQRQLVLEESRKKKDQDKDKQNQLRSQIISLQQEIDNMTEEVVSTLTGSDIKSAAEEFVDTWVQAWKAGETTLDAIEEKMDSVIENIIKKAMTNKIVGALLDPLYNEVDRMTRAGSEGGEELTTAELRQLAEKAGVTAKDINVALGEFYGNLESLGIVAKTQEESKQLSALQQGLQSMSETTANALEAYANSISQQVYLHSTLLTEIRDILLGNDSDMSMGVQAQMLLQLQQSHQVQVAIHAMLQGWSNANGMAVRVELV